MAQRPEVMSWGAIVGILLITGLVVGLTIGIVTEAIGVSWKGGGAAIGAVEGVLGVTLISRRRAALQARAAASPSPEAEKKPPAE